MALKIKEWDGTFMAGMETERKDAPPLFRALGTGKSEKEALEDAERNGTGIRSLREAVEVSDKLKSFNSKASVIFVHGRPEIR